MHRIPKIHLENVPTKKAYSVKDIQESLTSASTFKQMGQWA